MRAPRSLLAPRSPRAPRSLLAAVALPLAAAGLVAAWFATSPVTAQEAVLPMAQNWSFNGLFGTPDIPAAQRGLQVYAEVCSNCHALHQLHYRDLEGLDLTEDQVKAFASQFTVPQGTDDTGQPKEGPATPADQFRSPFPNEKAARAAMNGALPPDLSLIINAREHGPDYVYGVLTGYADAPAGFTMQGGMNYNRTFPGHQIAMPQPLQDGRVTYSDGTPTTIDQMARDVVTFLYWTSNPETVERKQMGIRIILFLVLLTGISYAVKRVVWSDVEH
jgi:ubiquinol-cytochrome c reductase cytochrome c1 subunit